MGELRNDLNLIYHGDVGHQGCYGSPDLVRRESEIPIKKVNKYLASQPGYTKNRRRVKTFQRRRVFANGIDA